MGSLAAKCDPLLSLINAHICTFSECYIAPLGRLFIVKIPLQDITIPPGGKRGEVTSFSRESRKRLMQLFASLDSSVLLGNTQFVTLTYHRTWSDDPSQWKEQLRKFIQRLERRYGAHALVWRLEYQKRGAPHFHMMVIGERSIAKSWVVKAWASIAHQESEYGGAFGCDVQLMDSVEKAEVYLAKYVAKRADGSIPRKSGRMWGVRHADLLPITLLRYSLDNDEAHRLKDLIVNMMDQARVSEWLRKGRGGAWTMLDAKYSLQLVDRITAGKATAKVVDYRTVLAGVSDEGGS